MKKGSTVLLCVVGTGTFAVADLVSPIMTEEAPAAGTLLRVADCGAVADELHDDAAAIAAAFDAARRCSGGAVVVFEKKIYKLGDNPTAWHHFRLHDDSDLVIDGNGATLLGSHGNSGFHFNGGRNITVRGLTFDTIKPGFTQGEVVALDAGGALDVKIMSGYPEPPDEAFLTANGYRAHGGGGRHMIVFENGGQARNTRMKRDHLYIQNITFENIDVVGSLNGGIRVSDMLGDVTLRDVRIIRLNLSCASGQDDARLRNVRVAGNTFICPGNVGLVALRPYRNEDGVPDTRDIQIIDNVFHVGSATAIRISGVQTSTSRGNTFKQNGVPVKDASRFTVFSNCVDTMVER